MVHWFDWSEKKKPSKVVKSMSGGCEKLIKNLAQVAMAWHVAL